jgi:hypothetical protein
MSSPHTFSIDTSICPSTKRTTQTRGFTFGPTLCSAFFQVLLLGWTPPSWRLEIGRIRKGVGVCVTCGNEVIGVEKPFRVFRHNVIGEAVWR